MRQIAISAASVLASLTTVLCSQNPAINADWGDSARRIDAPTHLRESWPDGVTRLSVIAGVQPNESKIVVTAPDGSFEFSGLSLNAKGHLVGSARNATTHNWSIARFDVTFFDKSGKPLKPRRPVSVDLIGIAAGGVAAVEGIVDGVNPKNVVSFALSFNDGSSSIEPRFKIQIVKPEPRSDLIVENERLNIVFKVTKDEFRFSMRNKSNVPVQLDWNTASYVDTDGKAQKVMPMPKGLGPLDDAVKLIDRNRVQSPSVIPPGGSIEEQVIPFDSVQHDTLFNKWLVRPFVQNPDAWKGRTFSLLLPLIVEGKTENIYVTFLIEDVVR